MFRIRQKSFIGLLFGCFLIIISSWLSFYFNVSYGRIILFLFITLTIIGLFGENLVDFIFDSFSDEKRKKKFQSTLGKLSDPEEKKKLILKWSKKINFEVRDFRDLIRYNKIEDDEFWVSFFLNNIKEIPRYQLDYFYGFLVQIKSKESRDKLKKTLVSRGVLIEDKEEELKQTYFLKVLSSSNKKKSINSQVKRD